MYFSVSNYFNNYQQIIKYIATLCKYVIHNHINDLLNTNMTILLFISDILKI